MHMLNIYTGTYTHIYIYILSNLFSQDKTLLFEHILKTFDFMINALKRFKVAQYIGLKKQFDTNTIKITVQ